MSLSDVPDRIVFSAEATMTDTAIAGYARRGGLIETASMSRAI